MNGKGSVSKERANTPDIEPLEKREDAGPSGLTNDDLKRSLNLNLNDEEQPGVSPSRTQKHLPKLANILSVFRLPLAILFAVLWLVGPPSTKPLLLLPLLMSIVTDIADGIVARRSGAASSSKAGAALDSTADDYVFFVGYFCIALEGLVPVWFTLLVILTRYFQAGMRLQIALGGRPYAGPRPSTKANGIGYWVGLMVIVTIYSLGDILNVPSLISQMLIHKAVVIMTALSAIAICDFTLAHRWVLTMLFSRK